MALTETVGPIFVGVQATKGIGQTVADQAFVRPSEQAEVRGTHYIEEAVRVDLMRDLDGTAAWVVDTPRSASRCTRTATEVWKTESATAAILPNARQSRHG